MKTTSSDYIFLPWIPWDSELCFGSIVVVLLSLIFLQHKYNPPMAWLLFFCSILVVSSNLDFIVNHFKSFGQFQIYFTYCPMLSE